MSKLLEQLNPEQLEAVQNTDGPLLIVAGAGTGKTHLLTTKIAYLIEKGFAKPDEILALTFTDKAAGEMEERVDRLLPYGYVNLWISTFHSFCDRILKEKGVDIGLPEYKLLSDVEQWMMIRENLDKFNLDYYKPMGNPTKFIKSLITHFSRVKDEIIKPEEYLKFAEELKIQDENIENIDEEKNKIIEIANAYKVYNQLLLDNGFLDFGDLINYCLKLFKKRPSILKEYQNKFKYILVDEFQDTNFAQYELVKILAQPKNNISVVGDDDQSIYRFRGASMSNILTFSTDYKEAKKVVLTKNYRSGQKILDMSYGFISQNNPNRLEVKLGENISKKLQSQIKNPGEVIMIQEASLEEEVAKILTTILEIKDKETDVSWNDFAILLRANESSKPFIHQAELLGIPYQFLASKGLYNKPVVTWVISFIKLLDNYRESSATFRVLSMPVWELSAYQIADISYSAKKKAISLYEACENIELYTKDDKVILKIKKIINFINTLREESKYKKPSQIIYKFLSDSGLLKYLKNLPENIEQKNNFIYLNKFYKKIKEFERDKDDVNILDFLAILELEIEAGERGTLPYDPNDGPEMIKIMTIHSSKGLEFRYVFVANLVDKRFPSIERGESIELPNGLVKEILSEGDIHLEEERRLFYVASTRAKEKLYLTWGMDYGGSRPKKPSRFLYEMGFIQPVSKEKKSKQVELNINENKKIENNDEQFLYSLPKQFSYSQIKAYDTCPYQYKLGFILNIPTEGGFQASFGRSIHNTLYKFFLKIKEGNKKETDKKKSFPSLKELEKIYEIEWINEWYESQEDAKKYKEKGWETLKNYYKELKNNPPKPLYLEQEFTLKFGDDSFRGVIDRIDDIGNNKVEILDYKTGSSPKNDKLTFNNKEQLLIYHLATKDILNLYPQKLKLYYIIDNKNFEFETTDKDIIKIKEKIIDIILKIKNGNFKATPEENACKYCDFKNICEFKK